MSDHAARPLSRTTPFKTPAFDPEDVVFSIEGLSLSAAAGRGTSTPLLTDLSLKIRRGETACLVGESGSGKSITSLAAMGLLPAKAIRVTGGRILLDGMDLLAQRPAKLRALRGRRISMIFQEPMTALNPVMRIGDQILEVLKSHGARGDLRRQLREIMEQVHLPDIDRLLRAYPHQLSGGQRQRVMIAMALVMRPRLLIADEPTTALDVTTQKQILALIAELQDRHGTAVLFITHDMGVVSEIADTVHVMRQGRLVESAPAEQIFRAPAQDYTRSLLAAVPSLKPRAPRSPAPAEARPALAVEGLGMRYGGGGWPWPRPGKIAAQEVSFVLPPGRTLGIVGESGSGKSTVARAVMRLIDPTAGRILVAGNDITRLSDAALQPYRAKFQIVFQDPNRSLNPRLRVADSLVEGPCNYGVPRPEALARARALMNLVGLPETALEAFPHQFSGGQRQRLAIARAVAMEPEVIVADEAVSALDVSVQDQVLRLLADLQDRLGIAILFITHDLRVAAQICDEVVVMQNGRVVEQGPAAAVLTDPRAAYTRSLIEAAPGRGWDFAACREMALPASSLGLSGLAG